MSVKTNLKDILSTIPDNVKLVAVSKTKPVELINEAYNAGYRFFGENKVQEVIVKGPGMPKDIEWHFIGHLQRNKVKYIAPFVSLIHSVDSLKLLIEINKQALKNDTVIDCLLEFHIASEISKFGLDINAAKILLSQDVFVEMKNIRIVGVMGMATFTDDENLIRGEFKKLKGISEELKSSFFSDKSYFTEVSMGMTNDYKIAIEEGSTMVRIGSAIFGTREPVVK